jgi:hypothetical protein
MDRGKFEDNIRRKFEGQTTKTPDGIWEEINSSLNANLVSVYASERRVYKWISIAALFIVVVLLGIIYSPGFWQKESNQTSTYNALLSNDIDYNSYFNHNFSGTQNLNFEFEPTKASSQSNKVTLVDDTAENPPPFSEIKSVSRKRPVALIAKVINEIYPYHSGGVIRSKKTSKDVSKKVWAGVEAGAGNFNGDFGGTSTLANSLNPLGLAAAIGSGSFANPTTNISQDMSEAIATTIGFDFGVKLGEKWTLESGLAYTSVENNGTASFNVVDIYSIDNNFIDQEITTNGGETVTSGLSSREGSREIEEHFDHEVALNNSVQFASVPVKAGYFLVNNRFSMRLNAGLSANYLMEGNISDPSRKIVNSADLNLYNDWSFDGIGGLEFGYSIFEKIDLTIEPNYRHSITPISNSAKSPSRILVQTGLRYTLK